MDKVKSKAVWGATPAGTTHGGGAAPGSKEFFEGVIRKRSACEMPWPYDVTGMRFGCDIIAKANKI